VSSETDIFQEKPHYQWIRETKDFPCGPAVPCPGKRTCASPKKAVVPLLPDAGFRRFQPSDPFLPASLYGYKAGWGKEGEIPADYVFGARPLARATSKRVRTTTEMGDDPIIFSSAFRQREG